jgi:hypothetical protein
MTQDTIAARSTVDYDAIIADHVEWVQANWPEADWDVTKHRYILDNLEPVTVDPDMLETFYGLQECGMRKFPEYNDYLGEVSFHEVKFYVFTEGWFLSREVHKGFQIAGLVLGGRNVFIEWGFVESGETITHELIHVLWPGFSHDEQFWNLHRECWREVWYRGTDE